MLRHFKGISSVQALLKELWEAAFPGEEFAVPSRRWKDMGWQGTDPATDFRGGGLMALQNLLYMAHRKPQLFDALLHKKQVSRTRGGRITFPLPQRSAGAAPAAGGRQVLSSFSSDDSHTQVQCLLCRVKRS